MRQETWEPEQDAFLRRHYGKTNIAEMNERYLPDRHGNATRRHASAQDPPREQAADGWTPDEDTFIRKRYPRPTGTAQ